MSKIAKKPERGSLKRKQYDKELRKLQAKLCLLQDWVKHKGARVIIVFEGRDAAGKGGVIKAITERVSPRVFRLVALPAPSDPEHELEVGGDADQRRRLRDRLVRFTGDAGPVQEHSTRME